LLFGIYCKTWNFLKIMNQFKNLSLLDNAALLKFPAYISMLAANSDDKLDATEKKVAIKFAHIKTFSCDPMLSDFYQEADQVFDINITQLDNDLPKDVKSRDAVIRNELLNLDKIVLKLGKKYAKVMHKSMKSFTDHVSKAHHNVLVDFLFPIPIPGLTDK
jgi:anaerobic ribonucleoside-triphosphate reductase